MQRTLKFTVQFSVVGLAVALIFLTSFAHAQAPLVCDASTLFCPASKAHSLPDTLSAIKTPNVSGPVKTRVVTYQVASKGTITVDAGTFAAQVAQTYADPRGWSRLGVTFKQVVSGGQFTVVLAQADSVPTFGSICDTVWSCTVGNNVIINQDRWLYASQTWNQAGGSLRDYRHMVVNHETGHWLGHGHEQCGGAGQSAPIMLQQSINLQGCTFNIWPLQSELWSTTLGIRS